MQTTVTNNTQRSIYPDIYYYFLSADGRVLCWDGWHPTNTPGVYSNGYNNMVTRRIDDLYDTEREATEVSYRYTNNK